MKGIFRRSYRLLLKRSSPSFEEVIAFFEEVIGMEREILEEAITS
ncbi:hypothetical protein [uncultured Bacteroides sp.]|nr:hypothetical protein [uncultured Bacteroides sp.]